LFNLKTQITLAYTIFGALDFRANLDKIWGADSK